MSKYPVKIIVVDDDLKVIEYIKMYFQADTRYDVIACFSSGRSFVESIDAWKADIIIVDIFMPEIDGYLTAQNWNFKKFDALMIANTMHKNDIRLQNLVEAGFKGCIFKNNFSKEIEIAIDTVLKGKYYFSKEMNFIK